ncbi:hypothetical protein [Streptomyces sp. TP-A0874]|uniref:hypothetical protein n=1 Tax=Streptomyces sp. TP-A0874 TaxID=549819 RepID=UPI00085290F2|nr:hypothetical protein [Streptomyces sp. TP-A0874]
MAGAPSGPRRECVGDLFGKLEEELRRNRPGGFGRLRLPQYSLMCSVVETDLMERQVSVQARELRDRCYAERRKDSNLLKALGVISGGDQPPDGLAGLVWYWLRQPLFNVLPRWLYGRLQERRMTRKGSWYRQWAHLQGGMGFFEHARRLSDSAQAPEDGAARRTGSGPEASSADTVTGEPPEAGAAGDESGAERAERYDRTTDVLLRALLSDLEAAFKRPRLSPWGRRRGSRFALVLPQIGAYPEWTSRLLDRFPAAVEQTGSTGVLLVAAVRSENEEAESFVDAAGTLKSWVGTSGRGGGRVVHVGVHPHAPDPGAARWLNRYPEIQPRRTHSDAAPRLEAALWTAVVLALLAGSGVYGVNRARERHTTECLGGTTTAPTSGEVPADRDPKDVYKEIRRRIERQNDEAVEAAKRPGVVLRTVIYLGVPVRAGSWKEAMYSGAIPELRGIALAQASLNREAAKDEAHKVWLRVRLEDAGDRFSEAPAVARKIVAEVDEEPDGPEGEAGGQIMGVVGLGQSREDTMRARDILGDHGLPMIGTVATAEEMLRHSMYRQVAPDNGREARIASEFSRHGNIVETRPGLCSPAKKAVVIANPDDTYSANLSERFVEGFPAAHTLWYSPGEGRSEHSAQGRSDIEWVQNLSEMAEKVCERLKEEPRTVVYWASRSNEFGAFLSEFDGGTACNGRVSVLGGDDLTNSVVDEQRPGERHPGVRLYYAAHALPRSYPPNVRGEVFRDDYADAYGADPWSDDGRAPLAWDALQVLAKAVNTARQSAGKAGFGRGTVQTALVNGVGGEAGVRGATGALVFGRNGEVPENKRLLILRHTSKGAEVALECGALDSGVEMKKWGPDNRYDCPQATP